MLKIVRFFFGFIINGAALCLWLALVASLYVEPSGVTLSIVVCTPVGIYYLRKDKKAQVSLDK